MGPRIVGMERKLFRTGNSLTVTIPPALASELGFKAGGMVELEVDREHEGLLIKRRRAAEPTVAPVTQEFARWVDGFIDRYDAALKKLSGRSEEHTSELQSRLHLVCRLLLEKKHTRHPTGRLPDADDAVADWPHPDCLL